MIINNKHNIDDFVYIINKKRKMRSLVCAAGEV